MDTRKISFDILKKIETEDAYVGDVLDSALRTMQFSDKADDYCNEKRRKTRVF